MISETKYNNEAIKMTLQDDVVKALSDFLNTEVNETYDYKYIGVVVDNNDPDKLGRCRLRVLGVFGNNIQDSDLPWALPDFGYIGGNKGSFIVPTVGTTVSVYFERGEKYFPRYNRKVMDTDHLPTNKDKDYPNNQIFYETDNGDSFEINTKRKETTFTHSNGHKMFMDNSNILFEHRKGTKLTIDDDDVTITHSSGSTITMDLAGNITIDAKLSVKTKHGLLLEDNGTVVVPDVKGPYVGTPICFVTGGAHAGQKCIGG